MLKNSFSKFTLIGNFSQFFKRFTSVYYPLDICNRQGDARRITKVTWIELTAGRQTKEMILIACHIY